jgi:predicted Fe-S protein YdhL (DUF1289 family)
MKSCPSTTVASPCTGVCRLDGDEICIGCFRSKDEIVFWIQMSEQEKSLVLSALDERRNIRT